MKLRFSLAFLCLVLAAAPALADDDCDVPVQYWQSRDAALRHAASLGWQVQRLKIDDGCYEIRGRDAQGRAFKAKLDPQTLRVVKMKLRNDDGNHERERERTRSRDDPAPATANPVSSPGTTPRGQIE
ncbi:MAG: PepSY domain-containing protein [Burkholderiaceae bacterium]|nr:PepSY domain-containing protein [Burkholderiaceae bacterium]